VSRDPNKIAEWKARIKEIDLMVNPLISERSGLEQRIRECLSPFKVGDLMEWNKGTRRGRVVEVRRWVCSDVKWIVQRRRKDGSLGSIVEVMPYMEPVPWNPV
jgi:hypothetical protein